jgi:protoporphyrinogen oxidase
MVKYKKKIAIIGAGFAGLSAAYDLVKASYDVTVIEATDHVGGLASGFKEPHWDWTVERYYHHWFASDKHILALIQELELEDGVLFQKPKTVVYYKGKYYPFDSIPAALFYPGLGWGINKIRFGLVGIYLKMTKNWKLLEKFTAKDWMCKWAGEQVYKTMWEPMMLGKFGETYASQVNMAWLWARLHARTTKLGTFRGGFQVFAEKFSDKLKQLGVDIQLNTPVLAVEPDVMGGLWVKFEGEPQKHFDKVLVTGSPGLLTKIAPQLPADYLKGLIQLKSMGAVVMILSLTQQLSPEGYYWYNIPKNIGYPFLSLVEHTNFIPSKNFGGDHIVYIGDYLESTHPFFGISEQELYDLYTAHLNKINPQFQSCWVKNHWLFKTKYAQPIPFINHSQKIPKIQTPLKDLYFSSMSQVYPWDRGTNFAVEIGRRAAKIIIGS